MFDFRRITLFCLRQRLWTHKWLYVLKIFGGGIWGDAYGLNIISPCLAQVTKSGNVLLDIGARHTLAGNCNNCQQNVFIWMIVVRSRRHRNYSEANNPDNAITKHSHQNSQRNVAG